MYRGRTIPATGNPVRLYLVAVILPTLAIALVGLCATVMGASTQHHPRQCFPAKSWGPVSDGLRPCVQVRTIYEDGSFSFAVSDANGTVRYTSGVGALDR